jgi:hypothetical protein
LQSQTVQNITVEVDEDLTEEELLLGPSVVYGFSLSDKMWCKLPLHIFVSRTLII